MSFTAQDVRTTSTTAAKNQLESRYSPSLPRFTSVNPFQIFTISSPPSAREVSGNYSSRESSRRHGLCRSLCSNGGDGRRVHSRRCNGAKARVIRRRRCGRSVAIARRIRIKHLGTGIGRPAPMTGHLCMSFAANCRQHGCNWRAWHAEQKERHGERHRRSPLHQDFQFPLPIRCHHPRPPGYRPKSGNSGISTEGFPSSGGQGQTTTFEPPSAIANVSKSTTKAFNFVSPQPSRWFHPSGAASQSPGTGAGPFAKPKHPACSRIAAYVPVGSANPLLRKERGGLRPWPNVTTQERHGSEGLNPISGFARCTRGPGQWHWSDHPVPTNHHEQDGEQDQHGHENQSPQQPRQHPRQQRRRDGTNAAGGAAPCAPDAVHLRARTPSA